MRQLLWSFVVISSFGISPPTRSGRQRIGYQSLLCLDLIMIVLHPSPWSFVRAAGRESERHDDDDAETQRSNTSFFFVSPSSSEWSAVVRDTACSIELPNVMFSNLFNLCGYHIFFTWHVLPCTELRPTRDLCLVYSNMIFDCFNPTVHHDWPWWYIRYGVCSWCCDRYSCEYRIAVDGVQTVDCTFRYSISVWCVTSILIDAVSQGELSRITFLVDHSNTELLAFG